MGCIYRRVQWHCVTCQKRLDKTAGRKACETAGHIVEERQSPVYWVKYTRAGKGYAESSGSDRKKDAVALLQDREGDIVRGKPVTPKMGRTTFEDASADILADYTTNDKRSVGGVERRLRKHLAPFFGGWRMSNITTSDVRKFIVKRQTDLSVRVAKDERRPASNAEINRELALLKRMFSLAIQAGKLHGKPHIPMLKENNVRTGFFEPAQLSSVLMHLPTEIRPVIEFAAITGWRIMAEVLPLQWRQVDFAGGEVRLDAGTTKNDDGRVFPMTTEIRRLLEAQHTEHERLKKAGHIVPQVFFREVVAGRAGKPKPIKSFGKAWQVAVRKAGCPGRIPHDLRRTAVRNLVRAGIPETVAMSMTGHKTRSVFERYNIVSPQDLKDAAKRLDVVAGR
jgi:integrase